MTEWKCYAFDKIFYQMKTSWKMDGLIVCPHLTTRGDSDYGW